MRKTGGARTCILLAVGLAVAACSGVVRGGQEPAEPKPPVPGTWLVRPQQTGPRILQWARKYPQLVSLHTAKTYGGHTAYAVTVTDGKVDAKPLGYGEDQLRYFRKCWSGIYRTTPHVIVEVQNNNVRTPPAGQMQLMETSIRAAVEHVLRQAD